MPGGNPTLKLSTSWTSSLDTRMSVCGREQWSVTSIEYQRAVQVTSSHSTKCGHHLSVKTECSTFQPVSVYHEDLTRLVYHPHFIYHLCLGDYNYTDICTYHRNLAEADNRRSNSNDKKRKSYIQLTTRDEFTLIDLSISPPISRRYHVGKHFHIMHIHTHFT